MIATGCQICPIGLLSTGKKHGMTDSHGIIHSITDMYSVTTGSMPV